MGFIREINDDDRPTRAEVSMLPSGTPEPHAEAVVDWKQQIFLFVYVTIGSLSVVDICHSTAYPQPHDAWWADTIISSCANFLTAHTILLLASAIHRTPVKAPYHMLLWIMRLVALVYLAASITRLHAFYAVDLVEGQGSGER